jgi:membrane protease YdiL (CAAX protease family)
MSWDCGCGITNRDRALKCRGCGWTQEQLAEWRQRSNAAHTAETTGDVHDSSPTRSGTRPFPTLGDGMMLMLLLVGVQLAGGVALIAGMAAPKYSSQNTLSLFVELLGACVSAVLVLNWARHARREPLRRLVVPTPIAPVPLVLALVATLGALVPASQMVNALIWLMPPGPLMRRLLTSLGQGSLPLVLASVVVVGPVSEELIFRGVLLRGFLENYRTWVAILLSSFLFAFIHLNPWQGASAFFLGCLFAWFVARSGSLVPAIAGHVLTNGLGVVAVRLGITTEGFQPWWLTALGVLVAAGGIVAFHRTARTATNASAEEVLAS